MTSPPVQAAVMPLRLITIAVLLRFAAPAGSNAADERHLDFIARLQEYGYHDQVAEYVERIRHRRDVPDDIKVLSDYLIGKSLLAGAEQVSDLVKRDEQLQRARERLDQFVRQNPDHDRVADVRMDLAESLLARGRVALLQADSPHNASRRAELQRDARTLFDAARSSFADARDRLAAEFKEFPAFIPEDQKRQREAKAAAQVRLMQAHLQLGIVEYECAQSYDKTSAEYKNTLEQAVALFEIVRTQFRAFLGGQYARMWQGKCFEEMNELGKAEGIYKELIEHDDKDASMQALQRQVQFFQIIVLNKRGDHILAADLARRWLQDNPALRHSDIGIGVQFEQAKGLIQQAAGLPAKSPDKNRLFGQAIDALTIVTRYDTMYRTPAIILQQKFKGMIGSAGAVLTFDRAVALADEAKDRGDWPEAAEYYAHALRLAKSNLDTEQLAFIRYKLCFAYFQTNRFYESAVLGEYVARRQRASAYAPPAAHAALEAYARAFNEAIRLDQSSEFEELRLTQLVHYVSETWPDKPEADAGKVLLGDLHLHFARFRAAAESFESVSRHSPDYSRALMRSGDAYWQVYVEAAVQAPEERDSNLLADALRRARENLERGMAEHRKQLAPDAAVPPELAEAEISLAEASIEAGDAAHAMQAMDQLVARLGRQADLKALHLRALIVQLRACVATENLRAAEQTMLAIEATGKDVAQITRVYLDLGKQLQAEMERLRALNDRPRYERTRENYVAFLNQMASRREGQTVTSLHWTGEAFFGLEMYDQAAGRFGEIINRSLADPKFLDQSKPDNRATLLQAKLRHVTSLRKQNRYAEAWDRIKPLAPAANTGNDPMHVAATTNLDIILERGAVLQDWGAVEPARLKTAIDHWAYWGQQLERLSPRPIQYWEVRVRLVRSLLARARAPVDAKDREQRLKQAEQQLVLLTKTSTSLGGPSFRSQFLQLQRELERELGRSIDAAPAKAAGN